MLLGTFWVHALPAQEPCLPVFVSPSPAVLSSSADKTRAGAQLQPTEPDLLADAQNWVNKWPDAVGNTSMLSALMIADEHWAADSW